MPIHVHPVLRGLELAEETEGLIQTQNSVGAVNQAAGEANGTIIKQVPVAHVRIIRGHTYTATW